MEEDIPPETAGLSLDGRLRLLPHKKIMRKEGSAKRRLKKYYKDRYAKTGALPKPILLAAKGVFEGRRCSGRAPALDEEVKRRFAEMAEASDRHVRRRASCSQAERPGRSRTTAAGWKRSSGGRFRFTPSGD